MLTESALCLVQEKNQLPKQFGVVTPSVAFGSTLRNRLHAKGIQFRMEE